MLYNINQVDICTAYALGVTLARPKSVSDTKTKIPLVLKMF